MSESLDRLLARTERRDRAPRGPCPDTGVLAAYLDGTLTSVERAVVETHAADCARCALHLATVVRLEDESGHPQHVTAPKRWRHVGWLLPAAAAVIVAGLYVAVPSRFVSSPPSPARRTAASRPVAPPTAPGAANEAESYDLRKDGVTARRSTMPAKQTPGMPLPDAGAAAPGVAERVRSAEKADSFTRADNSLPPVAAPAAAAPQAMALRQKQSATSEADTLTANVSPFVIRSPDPLVQWRVAMSRVQRSTDGGRTWQAERGGPAAGAITMGAATSANVCWLASPAGAVWRRSADGTWEDVSPSPANGIGRIEPNSDVAATVATVDGLSLRTADAGRTWTRDEAH